MFVIGNGWLLLLQFIIPLNKLRYMKDSDEAIYNATQASAQVTSGNFYGHTYIHTNRILE